MTKGESIQLLISNLDVTGLLICGVLCAVAGSIVEALMRLGADPKRLTASVADTQRDAEEADAPFA